MIQNNIKIDENVSIDYLNESIVIAEELEKLGYENIEILQGESRCDFRVILNGLWEVSRGHGGKVNLKPAEYTTYSHVSIFQRNEIYKKHFVSNSMKVITKKKIENACTAWMDCSMEMRKKQYETFWKL